MCMFNPITTPLLLLLHLHHTQTRSSRSASGCAVTDLGDSSSVSRSHDLSETSCWHRQHSCSSSTCSASHTCSSFPPRTTLWINNQNFDASGNSNMSVLLNVHKSPSLDYFSGRWRQMMKILINPFIFKIFSAESQTSFSTEDWRHHLRCLWSPSRSSMLRTALWQLKINILKIICASVYMYYRLLIKLPDAEMNVRLL